MQKQFTYIVFMPPDRFFPWEYLSSHLFKRRSLFSVAVLGTGTRSPMPAEKLICRECIPLLSSYLNSHPRAQVSCVFLGNPAAANNHIKPKGFVWKTDLRVQEPFFLNGTSDRNWRSVMSKLLFEQWNKAQFPRLLCPISFPFLSTITSVSSCPPEDLIMLPAPVFPAPPYSIYLLCPISSLHWLASTSVLIT